MGEVFDRYTDTTGKEHWCDTETGKHMIPASEYSKFGKFLDDFLEDRKDMEEHFYKVFGAETPEDKKLVDNYVRKLQPLRIGGSLKGWICPVCGRGLSPYTSVCPCKGFNPGWKVTC